MLPENDNRVQKVIELSKESLDAFCDDISTMFEVEMNCEQQSVAVASLKDVKKYFKKVTAVHSVKAQGTLEGKFQIVFDQSGLFTLAGVIVMLPAKRIIEETKRGTLADAQGMADAVGEVGNLLVGTWDRIFRDELDGHKHFLKTGTFIGDPWTDPSKVDGLGDSEKFHFVLYEISLESYPSFQCGALLPLESKGAEAEPPALVDDTPATETVAEEAVEPEDAVIEEVIASEEAPVETPETPPETKEPTPAPEVAEEAKPEEEPAKPAKNQTKKATKKKTAKKAPNPEPTPVEKGEPEVVAEASADVIESPEAAPAAEEVTSSEPVAQEPEPESEIALPQTIEEIDEPVQTPAPEIVTVSTPAPKPNSISIPTGAGLGHLMSLRAREVMGSAVVWVEPQASVSEVLTAMQQHDVGYVMVGQQGVLQGLVSKSNVLGAMSPYLRPVFSKWRRPADDATLDIKVQWIMSRPVRTVKPEASLAVIIEQMRQFGGRCLPVVAADGNVQGLITVFDILRVLNPELDTHLAGQTPQAPCLMV